MLNLIRLGKAISNFTRQSNGGKETLFDAIGGWLTKPDLLAWLTESGWLNRRAALKCGQFLPNYSLFDGSEVFGERRGLRSN